MESKEALRLLAETLKDAVICYLKYRNVPEKVIEKYKKVSKKFNFSKPLDVLAFVMFSLQYVSNFGGFCFSLKINFQPFEQALKTGSAYVKNVPQNYDYKREKELYNLFHIVFITAQSHTLKNTSR